VQMASGERLRVMMEALVKLTVRFIFTDSFVVGLDVLGACEASVDLGCHVLRLGQGEVSLSRPGARPRSSRLSLTSESVISARYETVESAWDEGPLEAANGLVEPGLKNSALGETA
jgi:hypothetical protein